MLFSKISDQYPLQNETMQTKVTREKFQREDVSFWSSTLFQILLETAQELKRRDINPFKNTDARQSALYFNQKTWCEFRWFSWIIRFYEKMNKAQMK